MTSASSPNPLDLIRRFFHVEVGMTLRQVSMSDNHPLNKKLAHRLTNLLPITYQNE